MTDVAFEGAAVLARLHDLLENNPHILTKEAALFAKKNELALFSQDVSTSLSSFLCVFFCVNYFPSPA